ncbi:hypothetical protein ACE6ED_16885 [Paenibacillus sp. CN-4]|uniref:hypothetical protein n=1 Tax=Paenibacillus nanchangensis TaxID=3348343 RepID=UPI00397E4FAB
MNWLIVRCRLDEGSGGAVDGISVLFLRRYGEVDNLYKGILLTYDNGERLLSFWFE